MLRRSSCPVDGTTDSSMAYADDPWCSDMCHKAFAEAVGLSQREIPPLVAWTVIDATWAEIIGKVPDPNDRRFRPSKNLFAILKEKFNEYHRATGVIGILSGTGVTAEGVLRYDQKPVDWTGRTVLLGSGPWGGKVSELRQPRPEVPYRVLPGQAVRGEATQVS